MRLVVSLLCASQEEEEKPDEKQTACEENQCCQTWTGTCPGQATVTNNFAHRAIEQKSHSNLPFKF